MKPDTPQTISAAALRQRAETIFWEKSELSSEELKAMTPDAMRQTLHELGVHQIELEMQNEELRRMQVTLDAARARYFDLYNLAPMGYLTLSETKLILEANITAATLLGAVRDSLLQQPLSRFIQKEDQDIWYLHHKQLLATRKPQACDLRLVRNDGTPFWAHLTAILAQEADGAPVCRVTLIDITERKRAEAEKAGWEASNRQLQKTESLGRMAGAIAHHFNNNLQVVMLNLQLAANKRPENTEPDQGLSAAMQAIRKAAEVGTQMLTYLGQSQVNLEPLDLAEVCLRSLALLQAALPPNAVLETNLPSPGPRLHANTNQIQQLLTNLVTNAWEASDNSRGPIRLAVKTVSAEYIPTADRFPHDWQPHATSAYACLEVADAGRGISHQNRGNLFDPFFSTQFTGRGMGLPVVLGIARAAGGGVTVESEPGRGSVFQVFFPLSRAAVTLPSTPLASIPKTSRGCTVLVVEDDPSLRETFALTLKVCDFSVLTAEDGAAALALFEQHRDDIGCVLCDVIMPGMNGWETLTALRRLAPDLPVILISGYSEGEVMSGDHHEQPHAFLPKPCDVRKLVATINKVWSRSQDAQPGGAGTKSEGS